MSQSDIKSAEEINVCTVSDQRGDSKLNSDKQGECSTNAVVKNETPISASKYETEDTDITVADGPRETPKPHSRQLKSQPSTLYIRKQQAVCVRDAHKDYGTKKEPIVILDGLNMTVPKGIIYGLLGASGCGKTTLLNCIVGRRNLNSGEIWVLGGKPGSRGSGVPGPRIGYMPQEVALYNEFTVRETLLYFGWVAGMPRRKINERIEFLVKLLMIPNAEQEVKNLSGGQQRRVSLAAALLHEPELIILDEPTVGLDPVLRECIWNHFVDLTRGGNTTIIITTHYIDETRQAHLIGLMRGGYFLAEEAPERLLHRFGAQTLEEVFLRLSVIQTIGNQETADVVVDSPGGHHEMVSIHAIPEEVTGTINETFVLDEVDTNNCGKFGDTISLSSRRSSKRLSIVPNVPLPRMPREEQPFTKMSDYLVFNFNHLKALLWKNFLWMWRNIPIMLCILVLPFVQSALFCICIGGDPINLTIAYVNYEIDVKDCKNELTCNTTQLSCNYMKYLEKRDLIMIPYDTEEHAIESVLKGKTYASIVVEHNYTAALQARLKNWQDAPPWDIAASEIEVVRDTSNSLISNFLRLALYEAFEDFLRGYLKLCKIDDQWLSIPVSLKSPVYGVNYPKFTDFVAPGLLLTFTCFLALGLTTVTMLEERNAGSLERALVIGITEVEILFSHAVSQFVVMALQSMVNMVSLFGIFSITMNGSLILIIILTLLTGFCGMCFGFCLSCVCTDIRTAFFAAAGSFMPLIVLGGIIWPIEGMHRFLKPITLVLPLTHATESLRSIMQRDWSITSQVVYMGFISISIWIVIFMILSILFLKFKKA